MTALEYLTMLGSLVGISMPVFWIGLMLIYWLGAQAGWFPLSGSLSKAVFSSDITGVIPEPPAKPT